MFAVSGFTSCFEAAAVPRRKLSSWNSGCAIGERSVQPLLVFLNVTEGSEK